MTWNRTDRVDERRGFQAHHQGTRALVLVGRHGRDRRSSSRAQTHTKPKITRGGFLLAKSQGETSEQTAARWRDWQPHIHVHTQDNQSSASRVVQVSSGQVRKDAREKAPAETEQVEHEAPSVPQRSVDGRASGKNVRNGEKRRVTDAKNQRKNKRWRKNIFRKSLIGDKTRRNHTRPPPRTIFLPLPPQSLPLSSHRRQAWRCRYDFKVAISLHPHPQTTSVPCTWPRKNQPQQQSRHVWKQASVCICTGSSRQQGQQPQPAEQRSARCHQWTARDEIDNAKRIKSNLRPPPPPPPVHLSRRLWVALDDADLVGDLECVEVLGEAHVRLLLAVGPGEKRTQKTYIPARKTFLLGGRGEPVRERRY